MKDIPIVERREPYAMSEYLIGDGIFTVKKERGRIIITLYAWTKKRGKEVIRLLDTRGDTEIRIHDWGYIYEGGGEEKTRVVLSFAKA